MSKLTFNEARATDIPLIADILKDATERKLQHGDTVWGSEGWTDEEIQGTMSESTVYIVREGEHTAGTVSLQWDDERSWGEQLPVAGYIHRLAIKHEYVGQGLGEIIIDWAAARAREHDRYLLRLDCENSNNQLCAYYEKLGFIKVGIQAISEFGDYVAALYEKHI